MTDFPVIALDPEGREITFNRERWSHIADHHGELVKLEKDIVRTIENPDRILRQGDRDDTYYYFRKVGKLKYKDYICAVINIDQEFLITAYPTDRIET